VSNIWILARKELKSYFSSPIAYIVLAMSALIFGYFFYATTAAFMQTSLRAAMQRGMAPPMNLNDYIVRPMLMNISVISLFLLPMITMRLFAEEKRSGTMELLLTSPLRDLEIILGKWLAALILYGSVMLLTFLNLGYLFLYGQPDWRMMAVGYLGLLLQGATYLGLGAFISTTTRNQIIASSVTFAVFLILYVLDWITIFNTSTAGKVISYLSITSHYESFARGVVDLKDVVYYLSAIFLGLFLTSRSLESLKWRA